MPELPEVETIRRELHTALKGRKIKRVDISLPKIVKVPAVTFRRHVVGGSVTAVHRRAKLLLVHLSTGWTIIIHLKMSGQLIWQPKKGRLRIGGHPIPGGALNLPNRYSHVTFRMNGGTLFFNDQRQFGFLKLLKTADLNNWLISQGYGPEPLSSEFTPSIFDSLLKKHPKKKIKPMLLDQTVIAGLGNIYTDEALHFARVRPTRRVSTLRSVERHGLYRGIQHVLNLAIRHRGTSADKYLTASGQAGQMQKYLKVYSRGGRPCRRCGGTIKKIVLTGRGTHFCPRCQL